MSYRLGKLTHLLVSKLVRTDLFALPNILAGEKIVPEFIQDEAKPKKMAKAIKMMLIRGRVKPIERREASSVSTINVAPIITSILPGLPTRSATNSGGNNGKYIIA